MDFPEPRNGYQRQHADLLRFSYHHWTGKSLVPSELDSIEGARYLYQARFVILSHGTEKKDPILNYANLAGLKIFELSWKELVDRPSRLTAEPQIRAERAALMKRVSENGYIDDYSGIRISKSGKRFYIESATVWNLINRRGTYLGQAARFSDWTLLEDPKPTNPGITEGIGSKFGKN